MSDLVSSLGDVFSTTADVSSDPSLLQGAAAQFDATPAASAATDAATVDTSVPQTDTGVLPSEQSPDTPAVGNQPAVSSDGVPSAQELSGSSDGGNSAPVSEGSTPIAGTAPESSPASWYKSLSPAAQVILAKGVAGGGAGLLSALMAKQKLAQERELIDQKREDVRRKGEIQAIPEGAFKRRGLIDGARG